VAIKRKHSLVSQIKLRIHIRILACLVLSILTFLFLTYRDLSVSINSLDKKLSNTCQELEEFIISQVLIGSQESINLRLEEIDQSEPYHINWLLSQSASNPKKIKLKIPFNWEYVYNLKSIDGRNFGTLQLTGSFYKDKAFLSELIERVIMFFSFFFFLSILLLPLARKIPNEMMLNPISDILSLLKNPDTQTPKDVQIRYQEIDEIKSKIIELINTVKQDSHDAAIGKLAAQVAHDIRSPLTVLDIETVALSELPEKSRVNIRHAIQRVNDIANNLLSKYKNIKNSNSINNPPAPELVSIMLENIVSEKRIQIFNKDIEINLHVSTDAYDSFINVEAAAFQRVLSNLINNSIESINNSGLITIEQTATADMVLIKISDNGCGIPKNKLHLVFQEGISFGKKDGSGLGLTNAINTISSWNGEYSLASEVGLGTSFEIIIPKSKPADWFSEEINISYNTTIIILDDDNYIHKIWETRFSKEFNNQYNLKVHHFYQPEELIKFCHHVDLINTRFLLDYELLGNKQNGLELAELLNIGLQSTLVTSLFEEREIRETCKTLGMKIIPKPFAQYTPIKFVLQSDIVYIDDEEIMTSLWQESAILSGKNLHVFNDPREFMKIFDFYNKDTLIYMDSSLGGNLKGEDFAKNLFEKGYQNIILATGFPKEKFKEMPWLRDVIDKTPPWN
jgi:signal transduction histidine kinase